MIVGLLSWYDESPKALALCIDGLAAAGVEHVVAVDGAYALYPNAGSCSAPDQHFTILATAQMFGMGCTIHVPRAPWAGNEVEKRTALFAAGWAVAQPGDWYWVIDADEIIVEAPGDVAERLAATDLDAATLRISDKSTGDDFVARRLYRADAIRVQENHYTYVRESDGAILFHGGNSVREVQALDLTDVVTVDHRPGLRPTDRQWAKSGYYDARDAEGVERGRCARCEEPAVTRMPVRWRFPKANPPESEMAELCARHAEWSDRENRRRLTAHGFDPDEFRWRERYTPLRQPAASAA